MMMHVALLVHTCLHTHPSRYPCPFDRSTRNHTNVFALNIALTSVRSIHNIQNCCLQTGNLKGFFNGRLKPEDFIVFAYLCMFIYISNSCLP